MTIGSPVNECDYYESISGHQFKDWQLNISSDKRGDLVENIVKNIVKAVLPQTSVLSERRRTSLLLFAHKIEKEHFDCSESKEEYFYLIAKKIQHIRREFEERRLLRKIDNLTNHRRHQRKHFDGSMNNNVSNNLPTELRTDLNKSNAFQAGTTSTSHHHQANNQSVRLSAEFRQQIIVKRILHVICPQRAMHDLRFLHLVKYAHKMEADCYSRAKSKENYFQLIAERVQRILIELNYKRSRREHLKKENDLSNDHTNENVDLNRLDSRNQLPKTDGSTLITNLSPLKRIFISSVEANQ